MPIFRLYTPIIIAVILVIALVGIAIHAFTVITGLSLPISRAVGALTLASPLLTVLFFALSTRLLYVHYPGRALYLLSLLPTVLFSVLAGLIGPYLRNSSAQACQLEDAWRHFFSAKNERAIRGIQDALQCCGLRSTVDRAWPFPGGGRGVNACREALGHTVACLGPWAARQRGVAGMLMGVVIATWVIYIIGLALLMAFYARVEKRRGMEESFVEEVYTDDPPPRRAIAVLPEEGSGEDRDDSEDRARRHELQRNATPPIPPVANEWAQTDS